MVLITLAAATLWMASPPEDIAIGPECQPSGTRAVLSSAVVGTRFWGAQLDAIAAEQQRLIIEQNKGDSDINTVSHIEARMDRLAARESTGQTEDAKEAFHAQRQKERLSRLAWLSDCADKIQDRIK